MKKLIFTITMIGVLVFAVPVLGVTTISLSPGNISVKEGQTFTVTVALNPQGVKNYTVKVELKYPANLLEVKSFTFENGWLVISQSGYDLVDNVNGVLIKSAGYAGGISSPVTFGTVTLLAKKSGSGSIEVGSNSLMLDASNQNVLSSAAVKSSVVISPKLVAQVSTPAPKVESTLILSPIASESTSTISPELVIKKEKETEQVVSEPTEKTLFATIGVILSLGTNSLIVGVLAISAVLLVAYFTRRTRRHKKKV